MTDKQIQEKLNQLVKIANELDAEARKRYSHPEAGLFFEADGTFYIMSGDSNGSVSMRQAFIEFSSDGYCAMGSGAW